MIDIQTWYQYAIENGIKIAIALLIAIIGIIAARIIRAKLQNLFREKSADPTIKLFIVNTVYTVFLLIVTIIVLGQMGVPTASLITLLGAGSIAIGLSIKSSLSNIASGLLLVFLKPFKIGDSVDLGGTVGSVDQINLFTTRIKTPNNEQVYIPNAKVMSNNINNKSKKGVRRLDLSIGISYDADIKQAKAIVEQLFKNDKRILTNPEPVVLVKDLADSAVMLAVRPWVKNTDYGSVMTSLLESIKLSFDEAKIGIPYPQLDVHMTKA